MNYSQSVEDRKKEIAFKAELTKNVRTRQNEIEGEFVENVLIKEVTNGGDKVFIINKLPKQLLFKSEQEMVPLGQQQYPSPTGKAKDVLLPGIVESQTGDGGFVFYPRHGESRQHLVNIDRYIRGLWPNTRQLPRREHYAMQPGNPASPPKSIDKILRVDLPTSPPAGVSTPAALDQPSVSKEVIEAIKMQVLAEVLAKQKEEQKIKMAKVREKKSKKTNT